MLKILCFGDSITYGEKDLKFGGWADRLKAEYFGQFAETPRQEISLYNLGIAGETTDGLVRRFETEVCARSIKGQNLLVVLAYGSNDIVIHKDKNIVPEYYFIRNLRYCIESAKKLRAKILLLSLLPISDLTEGLINQYGQLRFDRDIQTYNLAIKNLAHDMNCEYLDLYAPLVENNKEEYLSRDGLHPNSKGHQLLYQDVKNKILLITS